MKKYLAHLLLVNIKLYGAIVTLILLTPYVKSYEQDTQTFTTALNGSSLWNQSTVLKSKNIYKKEIYIIKNVDSQNGKALFLKWNSFSLSNGIMPTCSGAYLKVSTGCGTYEKEVGRFCGKLPPHDIYTFTSCIKIEWFNAKVPSANTIRRNNDNFKVTTGTIERSSVPTIPCNKRIQFTHNGVIFVNDWTKHAWKTGHYYCSFTVETSHPYFVIKTNRMESDNYGMDTYKLFHKVYITGQGTNQVKISFKMWTNSPTPEYFMLGWVTYQAPPKPLSSPSPSPKPTPSIKSENSLSKGGTAGLIVALAVFLMGIVLPFIFKLVYKHWKKSHQSTSPPPPQNANLNQAFNNNGDTSQTTEFPIQILRNAELSSGIAPPPKYADVYADGPLPPPPKYEEICS